MPDTEGLTPDQIAERDAHLVKAGDDIAREEAGIPHPEPGHDVREYRGLLRQETEAAAEGPPTTDELLQRIDALEATVDRLKGGEQA